MLSQVFGVPSLLKFFGSSAALSPQVFFSSGNLPVPRSSRTSTHSAPRSCPILGMLASQPTLCLLDPAWHQSLQLLPGNLGPLFSSTKATWQTSQTGNKTEAATAPQLTGSHSFQGTQFSPSPCSSLMRLLFSSISGSLPGFGCGTHSLSRRLPKGLRSHLRISAQESFLNSPDSDMPSCEFSKHCLKNSHPGSPGSSPFGGAGQPGGVIA